MGSRSSSKTSTASTFYDQRQVYDAGGGVVGTGNTQDQSLHLTDASNRSINMTDASSTVTHNTDGRAFEFARDVGMAQTEAARAIAQASASAGNRALDFATQAQQDAASFNSSALDRTFDLATTSSGEALGLARDAIAAARSSSSDSLATMQTAYQAAADTSSGNKTLIYAALAAVAVIGLAVAFKR